MTRRARPASSAARALVSVLAALAAAPRAAAGALPFAYPFTACEAPRVGGYSLASGDATYVCITINGVVTSLYNLIVDQFAAIQIKGSNYALPPGSGFIKDGVGWLPKIVANASVATTFYSTFDVSSHGAFSPYPRVYKRISYAPTGAGGAVATIDTIPVYTAIIAVDKGAVTSITWDDGCFFCAENGPDCIASALDANATGPFTTIGDSSLRGCRQTNDACYSAAAGVTTTTTNSTTSTVVGNRTVNVTTTVATTNSTLPDTGCDLKVFFVWTGTDRNKNALMSSAKRFSRYRQYGVASAYQSAINLATDAQNIAGTAINAVESVPGRIRPAGLDRRLAAEGAEGAAEGGWGAGADGAAPPPAPAFIMPTVALEAGADEIEAAHAAARARAAAREGAAGAAREGWAAQRRGCARATRSADSSEQ